MAYGNAKIDKKEVWVSKWKKKVISLRNLVIYSGIGIMGEISFDACDKVFLLPARFKGEKAGYYLKNNAAQEEIQIYIGSNMQTDRKVYPRQGETIEIVFHNKECKLLLQVIPGSEEH